MNSKIIARAQNIITLFFLNIFLYQAKRYNCHEISFFFLFRSLVSTNEHLLAELDIAKSRHQTEIDQLKWSYDQLRAATKMTNGHTQNLDTSAEF